MRHYLLELGERKFTAGIQGVPNGTCHLADVFVHAELLALSVIEILLGRRHRGLAREPTTLQLPRRWPFAAKPALDLACYSGFHRANLDCCCRGRHCVTGFSSGVFGHTSCEPPGFADRPRSGHSPLLPGLG